VGELRLVRFIKGSSCDQRRGVGPCRSEHRARLEHVPDGLGEFAGDLDTGDLRAALAAETSLGPLVVLLVGIMVSGMRRGLDERPAEVFRSVLHQRPAPVVSARLVHIGREPLAPTGGV